MASKGKRGPFTSDHPVPHRSDREYNRMFWNKDTPVQKLLIHDGSQPPVSSTELLSTLFAQRLSTSYVSCTLKARSAPSQACVLSPIALFCIRRALDLIDAALPFQQVALMQLRWLSASQCLKNFLGKDYSTWQARTGDSDELSPVQQ